MDGLLRDFNHQTAETNEGVQNIRSETEKGIREVRESLTRDFKHHHEEGVREMRDSLTRDFKHHTEETHKSNLMNRQTLAESVSGLHRDLELSISKIESVMSTTAVRMDDIIKSVANTHGRIDDVTKCVQNVEKCVNDKFDLKVDHVRHEMEREATDRRNE